MHSSTSAYAYIAGSSGSGSSYADASRSLLDMEWIAKYGVDDLLWFEGYPDAAQAEVSAAQLNDMSEDQRRSLILLGNPEQSDLSPRIWSSNPTEE